MNRSFGLGWGGIVCKTIWPGERQGRQCNASLCSFKNRTDKNVIGFENIELISDRPFEAWLDDLAECKQAHPDKMLIASIMEEYLLMPGLQLRSVSLPQADGFELNFSCPHGMPERKMGAAMGEDPEIVGEVTKWVVDATDLPVWAKMTPNLTDITIPAQSAVRGGAHGISAINTIKSILGINHKTLRPLPIQGYTVPGAIREQLSDPSLYGMSWS